jgi:hypothetical protein
VIAENAANGAAGAVREYVRWLKSGL